MQSQALAGRRDHVLNKMTVAGIGAVLLMVAAVVSIRVVQSPATPPAGTGSAYLQLAQVAPAARQRIDYARLDERLRRLAARPAMVGMDIRLFFRIGCRQLGGAICRFGPIRPR